MDSLRIDLTSTSVEAAVEAVGRRLTQVNQEVLPLEVATAAKVFRVGGHLFAETSPMVTTAAEPPPPMPDFSKAVTRPVGIGNLQVVRQELVGYRAGDISHIENVLEGELMRRVTRREEMSELILTEETVDDAGRGARPAVDPPQRARDRNPEGVGTPEQHLGRAG